jgi:cytidylate kinase
MVALQRRFAERRGAVMEGRDIGTKVFPDTPHKFFLTAPLEVRVQRRIEQLERAGKKNLAIAAIKAEVAERDARDTQRQDSPLTWDASYTVIDTAELSAQEAVDLIVAKVERSRQSPGGDY